MLKYRWFHCCNYYSILFYYSVLPATLLKKTALCSALLQCLTVMCSTYYMSILTGWFHTFNIVFCHTVLCGGVFILYCGTMHTTLWCCSILYCVILYSSVLWCLPCEPYYTRASMFRSAVLYILFYNVQYHSPRQTSMAE